MSVNVNEIGEACNTGAMFGHLYKLIMGRAASHHQTDFLTPQLTTFAYANNCLGREELLRERISIKITHI